MGAFRPIVYLIGRVLIVLAIFMLAPALIDAPRDPVNARAFVESAVLTGGIGVALALATRNAVGEALDRRQAYLLTLGIWTLMPAFGALPFLIGAPDLPLTDALFESVSGITTTGSSVIAGVDDLPDGTNIWRGMLNWIGGLGIAFIAMIFLPVMRVGGMQFFRAEGFDTQGKILPRATDIARSLALVYAGLTALCVAAYFAVGMEPIDAVVNGLATIATGGFSSAGASFGKYPGLPEYVGVLFMLLASLLYIRFAQLARGHGRPMLEEPQIRGLLWTASVATLAVAPWQALRTDTPAEEAFRETLFNLVSVLTGTGFGSGSFTAWGGFALVVAFFVGMIGGCTGSSSGALGVFRVQLALREIGAEVRRIRNPDMIVPLRFAGQPVEPDVINALTAYVTSYILLIGIFAVAIDLTGVDTESAIFAIWTSIGNIGYGVGPMLAETGTFVAFPDLAKWAMILEMLMGRLGLLSVLVVLMPRFWAG